MVSIVGPLYVMVTGPHTDQAARDALDDLGLVAAYRRTCAGTAADREEVTG